MKDIAILLFQLTTTIDKLIQPGGSRTPVAENLLLKRQLIIHSRARKRALVHDEFPTLPSLPT